MERIKNYVGNHFELILVIIVFLSIFFIHYLVQQKFAFLNFYYLPALLAGFYLGQRPAVLLSTFCILMVILISLLFPNFFNGSKGFLDIVVNLTFWGCFLGQRNLFGSGEEM